MARQTTTTGHGSSDYLNRFERFLENMAASLGDFSRKGRREP